MVDVEDLNNLEFNEDFDNCENGVEVEDVDEKIEPKVGMEFDGIDELYDFYKNYAKSVGFPVRKRAGRRNVVGILRSVTLSCSRAGKNESTSQKPLKPQPTCRIGCTAHITARVDVDGSCFISVVAIKHNHEMTPSKSRFFRCNRRMSAHVKHQLSLNDESGIRMNKNFSSLVHEAGGYENLSCNQKDCRNFVEESRRLRLGDGDACAIMKYFSGMVAENLGFYFDIEMDDENHLKNVFWADSRSREAYKEFDVSISNVGTTTCNGDGIYVQKS